MFKIILVIYAFMYLIIIQCNSVNMESSEIQCFWILIKYSAISCHLGEMAKQYFFIIELKKGGYWGKICINQKIHHRVHKNTLCSS